MSQDKTLYTAANLPRATGLRFAIVYARFNSSITEKLLKGATGALADAGAADVDVNIFEVPGCFELPIVAKKLAGSKRYDAVIALGAVIRGETPHFEYVAGEAASGIARAAYDMGVPIAFGVITTDTFEQAAERAGGRIGNKGAEAALTAVATANVLKAIG